ncbi:MAG: hypothetical protein AMXMBFR83_26830 [Phycisphaerae bacterium]
MLLAAGLAWVGGCSDPEEAVPPAKVEAVTHYGVTLDESATPQQVVYVLLRALADDVKAARSHRHEDQKKAALATWSLAAPGEIERRLLEAYRKSSPNPARYASLGAGRDKAIHRIVNLWAPIVAFYVGSFEQDPARAMARMRVSSQSASSAVVLCEVWPDPPGPDEAFNGHQLLRVELARETGGEGKQYWRVARVSFQPMYPRPATRPAGNPASGPARGSATVPG